MDGLEAIKALRERESGGDRYLSVIGLTANVIEGDREKCLKADMDGYFPKPVCLFILPDPRPYHPTPPHSPSYRGDKTPPQLFAGNLFAAVRAIKLAARLAAQSADKSRAENTGWQRKKTDGQQSVDRAEELARGVTG